MRAILIIIMLINLGLVMAKDHQLAIVIHGGAGTILKKKPEMSLGRLRRN